MADYEPKKQTVGELLSTAAPKHLRVPDWQREYSWSKKEVGSFWSDLDRFSKRYPGENLSDNTYFIGSVVLIKTKTSFDILDGQQRILTSAILLASIRDRLQQLDGEAGSQIQTLYLGRYADDQGYKYNLIASEPDREYFENCILKPRVGNVREAKPRKRIKEARSYFDSQLEGELSRLSTSDQKKYLRRLRDVLLQHVSVIAVYSDDEDDAADIFEVLNDRGMNLSTSDLLKNLLMRNAAAKDRAEIARLWRSVSNTAGTIEISRSMDTCLRHFWISNHGDVKGQSLYREIKEHFKKNEELTSLEMLQELQDFTLVYRDAITAEHDDDQINRTLLSIRDLGASSLYPATLAALQVLSVAEGRKLLKQLLVFYVRHVLVCDKDSSLLENVVYRVARDIRSKSDIEELVSYLTKSAPNNDEFLAEFNAMKVSKSQVARYLLTELELDMRKTGELDVAGSNKVHIEHIYPRKPRDGNKLEGHEELINRIGNLTLLSKALNTSIRNGAFSEKKPEFKKSDFMLTKELCASRVWNANSIEKRQAELANRAVEIWSML